MGAPGPVFAVEGGLDRYVRIPWTASPETLTEAVRRLVEQGPPAEEVGLSGYGADPALSTGPALISTATIPVGAPRLPCSSG